MSGQTGVRRVGDAGELITAIPALLGFVPHRSLVLAVLTTLQGRGTRRIRAAVRFDLDDATDPARVPEVVDRVETICRGEGSGATLAVVVDDRPDAETTADRALRRLARAGITPVRTWLVPAIAPGAVYRDLTSPGRGGDVGDPRTCPIALDKVLDGYSLHPTRGDLVDLLAPDPDLAERVAPLLDPAARRTTHHHDHATAAAGTGCRGVVGDLALTVLGFVTSTPPPAVTAEIIATTSVALAHNPIRDVMLGLAATPHSPRAVALWLQVARATRGTARATAAMLCGYSAYLRGDGVFAGICLAEALRADPTHHMAGLLDAALRADLPPKSLHTLTTHARTAARDLGIDLATTD
ncbi:DUF4192 domain-containing protein [Nocardia thailandica]